MPLRPSLALALVLFAPPCPGAEGRRPFAIEVIDDQNGRGVPLIELRTVHGAMSVTDSAGLVAFDEPGLMDQPVFFHVQGHGYEFPKDGFGIRGKALDVTPGGSATLKVRRINIAERLYRVTGAGIYRDSVLLGRPTPIERPVLNAKVLGSDSVINAIYRGKLHWFWGDTNRPNYPLGNFHVPGATSKLPADGGLDPDLGVNLSYFEGEDGFARPTAKMPGDGPTWIFGLVAFRDGEGRERMFAGYSKVRNFLDVYERGLVEFDPEAGRFEKAATFEAAPALYPEVQAKIRRRGGADDVVFDTPFPTIRVRAEPEALGHPERYEGYTCLVEGSRADRPRIDRDADGAIRYGWKRDTPAASPALLAKLLDAGLIQPEESLLPLRNVEDGRAVLAHTGSVEWNEYRGRWVLIAVESGGTSMLGEVWFAEADTPLGPWVYARKVATHDRYSFYNPKQHPYFAKDGGRVVYFEGTYTQTFSGNPEATPRYDYNQVMYRLDLSDPRLNLPVAVHLGGEAGPPDFFAPPRPGAGTVPVFASRAGARRALRLEAPPEEPGAMPLFHAFPADAKDAPEATVPLFAYADEEGRVATYATSGTPSRPGLKRSGRPLCRVWRNPTRLALPRGD